MELRHNGHLVEHFESKEAAQQYLDDRSARLKEQHPKEPAETGWTIEEPRPFVLKLHGQVIGTFENLEAAHGHREKHIASLDGVRRVHRTLSDPANLKNWTLERR